MKSNKIIGTGTGCYSFIPTLSVLTVSLSRHKAVQIYTLNEKQIVY